MALPDNRIRFPGPEIDFTTDVGLTGKEHDNFPAPGPIRFDHLKSYLIGLLSNQASFVEPIEFRFGTLWFDLNNNIFKFRNDDGAVIDVQGDSWVSLAQGIEVEPGLTLAQWFSQVNEILDTDITTDTSIFSRLTKATADEPITNGNFVYVNDNRHVKNADSSDLLKVPSIGVSTLTVDTNGETIIKHTGLATVRMMPGLTVNPGDRVYLDTIGRGTTVSNAAQEVGIVFDSSIYNALDTYPVAGVVLTLAGFGGGIAGNEQVFVAGSTISAGDIVYKNTIDNQVVSADASALSTSNTVVGVAFDDAALSANVTILNSGIVLVHAQSGVSVTAGQVIYLSLQTGRVTWIAPVTTGEVVFILGFAKNGTTSPGGTFDMSWAPRIPAVVP
jgi:predicted RecA/RadA family phage recombinase